jgi:hypothetical protein
LHPRARRLLAFWHPGEHACIRCQKSKLYTGQPAIGARSLRLVRGSCCYGLTPLHVLPLSFWESPKQKIRFARYVCLLAISCTLVLVRSASAVTETTLHAFTDGSDGGAPASLNPSLVIIHKLHKHRFENGFLPHLRGSVQYWTVSDHPAPYNNSAGRKYVPLSLVYPHWAHLGGGREIGDGRAHDDVLDDRPRHHRIDHRRRRYPHVFAPTK